MTTRHIYIKIFVSLLILVIPCLSFAAKITPDKANSLTASTNTGQYRVMVEFKNDKDSRVTKGVAQLAKSSVNRVDRETNKDAYLLKALKRQSKDKSKSNSNKNTSMRGRYIRPNLRTMSVTKAELMNLVADDELSVYEDRFHKPSLASSVDVVFPTQEMSSFSGAGQAVVVLDTGVNKNHSFLSGSVIAAAEACFSTTSSDQVIESLCPNGQDTMIGSGAGIACDSSVLGCAHGTQMAGVIAGEGNSFNGIAISASIIPIQIYSMSNNDSFCGDVSLTPCIGALESDIISALSYVDSIKSTYSIAAVNISFGTTATFQGQCDQSTPADYLSVVSDLTSSGIAVIASSGNEALENEMTSPACIEDVISVAATNDSDVAWPSNNRNSELDFFAPGVSVTTSSLPNNSFTSVTGTSIAAAHVSGAWAVMKSQRPNASVNVIRNRLTNTGTSVTQGLFTIPRLDITNALNEEFIMAEPDTSFFPAVYLLLDDD